MIINYTAFTTNLLIEFSQNLRSVVNKPPQRGQWAIVKFVYEFRLVDDWPMAERSRFKSDGLRSGGVFFCFGAKLRCLGLFYGNKYFELDAKDINK